MGDIIYFIPVGILFIALYAIIGMMSLYLTDEYDIGSSKAQSIIWLWPLYFLALIVLRAPKKMYIYFVEFIKFVKGI